VNGKSAISRLVTIISYINNTTSKVRDYIVTVFISILHFIKKTLREKVSYYTNPAKERPLK
jgi:hypothetical protein